MKTATKKRTIAEILSGRKVLLPIILLLLTGGTLISGCEEIVSGADVIIPYTKELVVQGYLTAGASDTIVIMRTLPPLEEWTAQKAIVTDAVGSLTVDGKSYPLRHIRQGRYVFDGVAVEPAKKYDLVVEADGLKVTATANTPPTPEILSSGPDTVENGCGFYYYPEDEGGIIPPDPKDPVSSQEIDAVEMRITYRSTPKRLYMVNYRSFETYNDSLTFDGGSTGYIRYPNENGNQTTFTFYTICLDPDYQRPRLDSITYTFYELEDRFTSYYETRWDDGDDLFFGPTADNIAWNVTGDGFGWFFGRSAVKGKIAPK